MWKWYEGFESTNIKAFGYNSEMHVMVVQFHHGGLYEYYDVPERERRGMRETPSKGKYFHKRIKKHAYKRIG